MQGKELRIQNLAKSQVDMIVDGHIKTINVPATTSGTYAGHGGDEKTEDDLGIWELLVDQRRCKFGRPIRRIPCRWLQGGHRPVSSAA